MRCRRLGTLEIKPDVDALGKTDLLGMLGRILSFLVPSACDDQFSGVTC